MLASGDAPDEYRPHLMTLLDETPLPVVIKAFQEVVQRSPATTPKKVMQHMARWDDVLQHGTRDLYWTFADDGRP